MEPLEDEPPADILKLFKQLKDLEARQYLLSQTKRKMTLRRFLMLTIPAASLSVLYSLPWYWGDPQASHEAIYPTVKPFVYRALMPFIGQAFDFGFRLDLLVIGLIALSGAAFILALHYLASAFYIIDRWGELKLIAIFGGYLVAFCRYPKIYDLMSAALFTLCLAFLARGMLGMYLIAFTLAAVNRETIILLVPVFIGYLWSRR